MVDYSKWKNIEISDDEDDTHPNVDTPSLFRWRHQTRVERMEKMKKEKEDFEQHKVTHAKKFKEVKEKLSEAEKQGDVDISSIKTEFEKLLKEEDEIKAKEDEMQKTDKKTPWNVDTISREGFTKTVVNKKPQRAKEENLSEEEREKRMYKFIKDNEKDLKHFGMLRRYDDSKKFLQDHPNLVCGDTANYLVIWCINLVMEEKSDLMEHVAHQTICMQYILELAKQLDYDPRACIGSFFTRIQVAEPEYKASFDDELFQFKERIRKRASEKLADAMKEFEEEEHQKRLGPGGLHPVEVMESLPEDLQKCFTTQNIQMLHETLAKMTEEDARYHIKRCVDSGLWVPDGNKDKTNEESEVTETAESSS